jgi:ribosomal protein S18 acetylase RimI-like enzyme
MKDLPLTIRPYQASDKKSVIALWTASGLVVPWNNPVKDIERKLKKDPELFFVGLIRDQIVGTCMAGYDGHRGSLYYLATHPDFRKKGIATTLIRHAQEKLSSLGCPKINLMVRHTNENVLSFYKKLGYLDDPVAVLGVRLIPDSQE